MKFYQTDSALRNQQASIQNLENQIGQISKILSKRQQGALPSTTESNSREHVNAITLCSGKFVSTPSKPIFDDSTIDVQVEASSKVKELERQKVKPIPAREYQPKIPYPARLKQVEAQEQMPKYAKFLKDILNSKSKLEEVAYVKLNEECSAVFQSKLPEKHHDPGSFTIPCTLGNLCVDDALADLGASVNGMPTSHLDKLEWMTGHPNSVWRAPPWPSAVHIGPPPCGYMPQALAYNEPTFSICQWGRNVAAESS
ncbi:uncharacterized protein LOC125370435 [Ricinus communis]|uniref:uncharacterized protein LOC125370435 n=1 Tax=Ricinus communis TaxID=3988 RepID=UPI00201B1B64|nr:uncharacterized protein LOC125370435 [Ricinus communis]